MPPEIALCTPCSLASRVFVVVVAAVVLGNAIIINLAAARDVRVSFAELQLAGACSFLHN